MEEMLIKKSQIIEAAILAKRENRFTLANICEEAGITEEEFYQYFNAKSLVLAAFYPLLIQRYEGMIEEIEGFDQFDLAEKLSNLLYTLFDMLQEQREFVDDTFEELVVKTLRKSSLEKTLEALFEKWLTADEAIPSAQRTLLLNGITYELMAGEVIYLINFWRQDSSEGFEQSIAMVDKLVTFFVGLLHSPIIDSGIDLAGYLWRNQALHLPIPFFRFWMSR